MHVVLIITGFIAAWFAVSVVAGLLIGPILKAPGESRAQADAAARETGDTA